MIHFIFTENDPRYLFLKFDTPEDDLWLASNKDHVNLTDHLNLVDPVCYLASYQGREPYTQDFLFAYIQPTGQKVYYCSIGLWQEIYIFFRDNKIEFDGLLDHTQYFKRPMIAKFKIITMQN